MTRDDIIRMAREANFYESEIGGNEDGFVHFAALVAAAEREACAKVCEELAERFHAHAADCAAAIRARSNVQQEPQK